MQHLKIKADLEINVDSEAYTSKCNCQKEHDESCSRYTVPVRVMYNKQTGYVKEGFIDEVKNKEKERLKWPRQTGYWMLTYKKAFRRKYTQGETERMPTVGQQKEQSNKTQVTGHSTEREKWQKSTDNNLSEGRSSTTKSSFHCRLAREELTKEAKRGAERAKEIGAYGWVKRQGASTDKKFLGNVLVSTLRSNKRKPSRDHDHRSLRRKYEDKRESYDCYRHSYHPRHNPPKLVNGGYFRYNDQRRFSHTENGKKEEKVPSEKFKRRSEKDDSISDRLKDVEKEEMKEEKNSEHEKLNRKELRKEHKKDLKNKKCRDDIKKDREKKTAKERRKNQKWVEEEALDLISKPTYHKDTGQGHRKRNISSKSEEESLLEDIKKHKDSDNDKNPQEKIIEIFGDFLIEKKQKKKKLKHKSHKAKHKHKKHKHKHDKANKDS
ncbi:unnamed protein product [Mytilus coruscus]|uniref:Uncharacterized protein n=1 Tax=Mytilus coruscus TaxID=42192 RepID=A0A6J8DNJ0_MYTCO|nr:unnamed protein product [Mytilus coruscus]